VDLHSLDILPKGQYHKNLNSFWYTPDPSVGYQGNADPLWNGNGITSSWSNTTNSTLALCNNANCRIVQYNPWQWKNSFSMQSAWPNLKIDPVYNVYPWSGNGVTAAFKLPFDAYTYICNGPACWLYNTSTSTWENYNYPVALK
jgi:hypothetical protein